MAPPALLSLLSDFGPGSVYVGQMHAVIARRAPQVRVIDLAHDLPFGQIESAAYVLRRSLPHFPTGSVHVAVVDPGVGSSRRIVAVRAQGHLLVAPDNGLLWPLIQGEQDVVAHEVTNTDLMNESVSHTFHGRDIFAPIGAWLACGGALEEVGPPRPVQRVAFGPTVSSLGITGRVLMADRFGNLITNIPRQALEAGGKPERARVRVGHAFIDRLQRTFSDVPEGVALVYVGSGDHLEIAVNGGRAADLLRLGPGAVIRVEWPA